MRRVALVALAAAVALGAAAGAGGASAAPAPEAVTVQAAPGQEARVARMLARSALRVQRRHGNRLQVVAGPALARRIARLPGVAAAGAPPAAFADQAAPSLVESQGLLRTGARALAGAGAGGDGLVIAILDLGFGTAVDTLRAKGELPAAEATEVRSFDTVHGLAGRNAYGNPTNHGELVAQTVFDYAPRARYLFVNYRTPEDFVAAVDWLVARRPDIVVHSNNFIEGPFDGTGPAARAVDRGGAAGILWFNSAGNYARKHWAGPWTDPDGDGVHEFPVPDGGVFYMGRGRPVTFALTWDRPASGPVPDLDLVLERRTDDGARWEPVTSSGDRQSEGAATAERITGYLPPADGFFRVRIAQVSGPPPGGDMTLFSREIDMSLFGGAVAGSVPTPGDAAGGIAVGAVDWRGDRLEDYSSQGPTADGRRKPDLVAPTDTSLAGPSGPRLVGGTSNAAPNAAGAAALLTVALRRSGRPATAADVRASLAATALDLGVPGPDDAYGAGRVRVELDPPALAARTPRPGAAPVRGTVTLSARLADPSQVARASVGVDGRVLASAATRAALGTRLDTRTLRDGVHLALADGVDWAGNAVRHEWTFRIDNTPPAVALLRTSLARPPARIARVRPAPPARRPRLAWVIVRSRDAGGGALRVAVTVERGRARTAVVRAGGTRRIAVGAQRPGRALVTVRVRDRAGNVRTLNQVRSFR